MDEDINPEEPIDPEQIPVPDPKENVNGNGGKEEGKIEPITDLSLLNLV